MTELPIMPFYVDDWILDTRDLSPHAYMAYHRLICEMWRSRSDGLPMDHQLLRNRAGITPQKWGFVWAEIEHLLVVEDGQVRSLRGVQVKAKARARYAARSQAGRAGAKAKWRKTKGSPSGKANGKSNGKADSNHNHTGINTSAREARGLSDFQIKWIESGKAPSPIPAASKIREAIELGQITEELANATMRGYF
jgi:uncharacterized protein YdaU (DUF1376 family)